MLTPGCRELHSLLGCGTCWQRWCPGHAPSTVQSLWPSGMIPATGLLRAAVNHHSQLWGQCAGQHHKLCTAHSPRGASPVCDSLEPLAVPAPVLLTEPQVLRVLRHLLLRLMAKPDALLPSLALQLLTWTVPPQVPYHRAAAASGHQVLYLLQYCPARQQVA
jgi:hypothetical protein